MVIEFSDNLPTDSFGRSVIEVEFELPMIVNRVTIDGTSRSDYVPGSRQPRIIIRYSGTAITANGLLFAAGSSRSAVRALAIEGFPDSGIVLAEGDRYTVEECNIGLAWHPAAVSTNGNGGNGIGVYDGSSSGGSTLIRDNLIAYNGNSGIRISNGSAAVIMQGNIIGLRPPVQTENRFIPAAAAGNGGHGVEIRANAGPNNFIGLINPNTISNNIAGEILIEADQQSVIGNLIGLPHEFKVAADFTAGDYGRGDIAVDVRGSDNVIGGDIAANANHIGNAVLANLRLRGKLSTGNQIRSNFIGVMPNGTEVSASRGILIDEAENTLIDGVVVAGSEVNIHSAGVGTEIVNSKISNGATGVLFDRPGTLGGESLASANVVGENDIGVLVRNDEIENPFTQGGATQVQFNYLGTNADGDDLGNNLGIRILRAASGAELKVIVDSNVIGFSSFSGIEVTPRSFTDINGVEIIRNRIGIHPSEQPIPNKDGILMQATSAGSILNCIVGHSITSNITTGSLGNDIAFNTQSAVVLKTGAGTPPRQITIRGNRIFGNAKGINLGPGGDTVDPDDFDTGPNELQNYPEFDSDQTFIDSTTGDLHYRLRVQTSAGIQGAYPLLIDFYLADGQLAQGKEYLGTVLYEEQDAQEWVTGSLTPVIPVSVTGRFLVATASRRNDILFGPTVGETSEFNAQAVSLEPDLPLLELQPEALDFGEQAVGTPISASFLIRNSGAADLVLGSFAISGPQAGDFSIIAPNNCDGATIAVGLSCIVEVAFSPLQEGVRRAEVTIPSNDPNGPHSLDLTGGSGDPIFVDSFESR